MIARHSREGTAGFSLVEMLVVLAILGLAVGIGAPSLGGIVPSRRLNAAAEAIVGEIALLRIEAQRTGRAMSLAFDEETRRFVSARPGAPVLAMPEWRVLVETGTSARVAPREIRFLPDGGSTGARITLSGSGGTRILVVGRATGAVRRAEAAP
jgi:general secretion pathway protein H